MVGSVGFSGMWNRKKNIWWPQKRGSIGCVKHHLKCLFWNVIFVEQLEKPNENSDFKDLGMKSFDIEAASCSTVKRCWEKPYLKVTSERVPDRRSRIRLPYRKWWMKALDKVLKSLYTQQKQWEILMFYSQKESTTGKYCRCTTK